MDFKKINILIGPNNSGKSNLVQSINFFPDLIVNTTKGSAFLEEVRQRGWDDVLRRDLKNSGLISMNWVMSIDETLPDLTYELQFKVTKDAAYPEGVEISKELLHQIDSIYDKNETFPFVSCHSPTPGKGECLIINKQTGVANQISLSVLNTESVLRQMKLLLQSEKFRVDFYLSFIKTVESIENYFEKFRTYSSTDFHLEEIRLAQSKDNETLFLNEKGTNFVNVLANLEKKHPLFISRFTQRMQVILPQLESLHVQEDSDGKRYLQVTYAGKSFKLSELSDGTVKAFLIGLLLWSPEKLEVLTLDEPELNMHPAWLRAFGQWIQASKSIHQVFLSTHSPDLLDHFTEGVRNEEVALFVCNDEAHDSSVERVDPKKLEAFFEGGYKLGDLYRVGEPRLGGWPL